MTVAANKLFHRLRVCINVANLAATVAIIVFAIVVLVAPHKVEAEPWLARLAAPVRWAAARYRIWSIGARLGVMMAAIAALSMLLFLILLSFKARMENLAIMVLAIPFYLLVAVNLVLFAGLVISLAVSVARLL